jgi:hypothetical protein
MNESIDTHETQLDAKLRAGLGSPAAPNFSDWQARHAEALAYLNPVVTAMCEKRRATLLRIASAAVAAMLLVAVLSWLFVPQQESYAQAARTIDEARTVTWTMTSYHRVFSRDRTYSWINTERCEFEFMYPGFCRMTTYDDNGQVAWVNIVDNLTGKRLTLNMKEKKVDSHGGPHLVGGPPEAKGPFDAISETLKTEPLELIGQRQWNGRTVNVVRVHIHNPDQINERFKDRRLDYWFDADTKQLVGTSDIDIFDPAAMPDRNNAPGKDRGRRMFLGSVKDNIVFNSPLDPSRFSLEPPPGFEVIPPPPTQPVSEDDLIAWLRATARVNNDMFTDEAPTLRAESVRAAFNRKASDRERELVELYNVYRAKRNVLGATPLDDFREEQTSPGSFRYAGRGVKLGDGSRIVCWFQPKNGAQFRAVYGNLAIREISPKELPLPID